MRQIEAPPTMSLPQRQGFTLTELLVVIAIIALLASLLLPSLSRAKRQARLVQCVSNLHQIGFGFEIYIGDLKRYPPKSAWDPVAKEWKDLSYAPGGKDARTLRGFCYSSAQCRPLFPYLGPSEVFHCPEDKGQHT